MINLLKRLFSKPKIDEMGERKRKLRWYAKQTIKKYHKTFRKLAKE